MQQTEMTRDYLRGMWEAARVCDKSEAQIRCGCGNLTVEEMRIAKTVLDWIQAEIREKADAQSAT